MNNILEEQQPNLFIHPFKRLYDVDLDGERTSMYGPSSSSGNSDSCISRSNHTGMTATPTAQTSVGKQYEPRVSIIIDQQPEHLGYGKSIFGRLFVDTKGMSSPTCVKNLRVSLFGHTRVHSDIPDQPLSKGLFDYKRDTKILSTGVRIIKYANNDNINNNNESPESPPFLTSDEQQREKQQQQQQKTPGRKQSKDKGRMVDPDAFNIYTGAQYAEEQGVHSGEVNSNSFIDSDCWLQDDNKSNNRSSSFKQASNKAIEQLMDQIALNAPSNRSVSSHGMSLQVLNAPKHEQEGNDKNYNLEPGKNHRIRFSIPITTRRPLPGSFDHKNYPIRYHILALLIYTTDGHSDDACFISHTVMPLEFQPTPITSFKDEALIAIPQKTNPVSLWITNSKLDQLLLSVKSKQAVKTMPPPPTPPNIQQQNLSTFSQYGKDDKTSNEKLIIRDNSATWMSRLLHHLSDYYVQRCKVLTTPYLTCSLELPHKTFCHGDPIPLRVHIENTGLEISQVIIETKIKQRLYMTYHCGEMAESKLIDQATTLFTANAPIQLVSLSTVTATKTSNKSISNINNSNQELSTERTVNDSGMALKRDGGNDDKSSTTPESIIAKNKSLCSSRNIVFDLTKVLYVSDQCTHTVLPQMTKNTFEISYELQVAVSVIGSRVISTTHQDGYQSFFYATADQHFSRSNITRNKGYLLKPPCIPIIIGSEQTLI